MLNPQSMINWWQYFQFHGISKAFGNSTTSLKQIEIDSLGLETTMNEMENENANDNLSYRESQTRFLYLLNVLWRAQKTLELFQFSNHQILTTKLILLFCLIWWFVQSKISKVFMCDFGTSSNSNYPQNLHFPCKISNRQILWDEWLK